MLFGSGYLANLGTIGALAGPRRHDLLRRAQPRLDHRRLPRLARRGDGLPPPRHRSSGALSARARRQRAGRVIVSDSVFSMDGDVAPLARIVELARAYDARTIVDEAHATGALGDGGRGAVAPSRTCKARSTCSIGTLGKALGSYGAYACASEEMVQLPGQHRPPVDLLDRPLPAVGRRRAGGAGAARSGARAGVSPARGRAHAARSTRRARALRLQRQRHAHRAARRGRQRGRDAPLPGALERGVFAQAIRPPTVPEGTSRLRLAAMASHTATELREQPRAWPKRHARWVSI